MWTLRRSRPPYEYAEFKFFEPRSDDGDYDRGDRNYIYSLNVHYIGAFFAEHNFRYTKFLKLAEPDFRYTNIY